ncbi:MAG: hypothetical protein M1821_001794 [Bathelium mastoideum]|nr:MAG: hypothetical protein M1821_001794 [Bathelium mastoideum]
MTKDWGSQKAFIRKYYVLEGHSLAKVARMMQDDHGFTASIRSYRNKLSEWGFLKTNGELQNRENVRRHPVKSDACGPTVPESSVDEPSLRCSSSSSVSSPPLSPPASVTSQERSRSFLESSIHAKATELPSANDIGLYEAILDGDEFRVEENLSAGFPRSQNFHCPLGYPKAQSEDNGESFVNLAARQERPDVLSLMLRSGFDANFVGKYHRTALHVAAMNGRAENVTVLAEYGASHATRDYRGYQPLYHAVICGHVDTTRELLKLGADVDDRGNSFGLVPLKLALNIHSSCGDDRYVLARLLLEYGASISPVGLGEQELFYEFLFSCITGPSSLAHLPWDAKKCLELFLQHGADPIYPLPIWTCLSLRNDSRLSLLHETYHHTSGSDVFDFVFRGIIKAQKYDKWITYISHIFQTCPGQDIRSKAQVEILLIVELRSSQVYPSIRLSFCSSLFNLLLQLGMENELFRCIKALVDLGLDLFYEPNPVRGAPVSISSERPFEALLRSDLGLASTADILRACFQSRAVASWHKCPEYIAISAFTELLKTLAYTKPPRSLLETLLDSHVDFFLSQFGSLKIGRERVMVVFIAHFSLVGDKAVDHINGPESPRAVPRDSGQKAEDVLVMLRHMYDICGFYLRAVDLNRSVTLLRESRLPDRFPSQVELLDYARSLSSTTSDWPSDLTTLREPPAPYSGFADLRSVSISHDSEVPRRVPEDSSTGGNAIWGGLS